MRKASWSWLCELDGCGHEWWAKSDAPPRLCAGCKRSGWHKTLTVGELVRDSGANLDAKIEAIARRVFAEEWEKVPTESVEDVYVASTVETLPETLEQKRAAALAALASVGGSNVPANVPEDPCPWRDPADEAGDIYGCALRLGHKGLHVKGPKVGDIW